MKIQESLTYRMAFFVEIELEVSVYPFGKENAQEF